MKKQIIYHIEPEHEPKIRPGDDFWQTLQTAILLSLTERGLLSQWQFERCREKLRQGRF